MANAKKTVIECALFCGFLMGMIRAQAETYSLTVSDGMNASSFTTAANWQSASGKTPSVDTFPIASDTFVVPKGKLVRTPVNTGSFSFPATVQFGDQNDRNLIGRFCSKGTVEFGKLVLRGGRVCDNGGFQVELAGPIEVTASTASPFILNAHQGLTTGNESHFLISGTFSSAVNCGMDLAGRSASTDGSGTDAVFNLTGDTSAYLGQLNLRHIKDELAANGDRIHLNLGMETAFPGTLSVYKGGTIGLCNGKSAATIGTLALYDGSALDVSAPGSCYTVGALTVAAGATTTLVPPVESDAEKTNDCPARTFVQTTAGVTLDPMAFTLDPYSVPNWRVQNGASANTLELLHGKTVTLVASDGFSGGKNICSFSSGTNWSDHEAPDGEKDYLVPSGFNLRSDPLNVASTFGGRSLMLADGNLDLKGPEVVINDLRIVSTAKDCTISQFGNANTLNNAAYDGTKYRDYFTTFGCSDVSIVGGKLSLKTASSRWLILNVQRPRGISIAARIVGTGNLYVNGGSTSANTGSAFDQTQSFAELSGDNSGWHDGRVEVHSRSTGLTDFVTRLAIHAPGNLGGSCSAFTYNALALFDQTELYAVESMTLDDSTRGIAISGSARVNAPDGVTFAIDERMDLNGTLTKVGSGTFALGGPAPTFATKTTPTAGKNMLVVNEGALKVGSSEAFAGLAVTLADGVKLRYDIPTDMTTGVGRYGMSMTHAQSSLTVSGETVTVQIGDPSASASLQGRRKDWFVGLATFADESVALAFADKVRFGTCPYAGESLTSKPVVVNNGDGTYTVGATLMRKGLILTVW